MKEISEILLRVQQLTQALDSKENDVMMDEIIEIGKRVKEKFKNEDWEKKELAEFKTNLTKSLDSIVLETTESCEKINSFNEQQKKQFFELCFKVGANHGSGWDVGFTINEKLTEIKNFDFDKVKEHKSDYTIAAVYINYQIHVAMTRKIKYKDDQLKIYLIYENSFDIIHIIKLVDKIQ